MNGVRQGRKQFSLQGASALCKQSMWKTAAEVVALLGNPTLQKTLSCNTYQMLKKDELLEHRRKVKEELRSEALKCWVRNGGEGFTLLFSPHA